MPIESGQSEGGANGYGFRYVTESESEQSFEGGGCGALLRESAVPQPTLSTGVMKLKEHLLPLVALTFAAAVLEANPNDLNKDKRISWEEFETFQQKEAKKSGRKFDAQQAKYLFEDKDRDGSGSLSYKEFASNHVDGDGDKFISFEEYAKEMKKRGARNGRPPTDAWMKEMFAKKDTDGDGRLTYQEMAKPVRQ